MREIFQLVGETAAHSFWAVADGENLDPILTTMDKAGKSQFLRLAMDDCAEAVRYGHDKLEHYQDGKLGAVFIADGFITLDSGKTDALVVEIRVYSGDVAKCQMVIPYRPANSKKGFAIHRPQVTELENIEEEKFHPLMQAFYEGIEAHRQGSKIWDQYYIDQIETDASKIGRSDFNKQEWQALQLAPALVLAILNEDTDSSSIRKSELLKDALAGSAKYQSDLLHSLVSAEDFDLLKLMGEVEDAKIDCLDELASIGKILEERVPSTEAKGFKVALIALAHELGKMQMETLALDGEQSDKSKFALASIILCLNVELDS